MHAHPVMTAALLAAGIESLIVFVIIAIFAALSSVLQKRQRRNSQEPHSPGQDPGNRDWNWPGESSSDTATATPATNWEEELKRLLGQAPAEPPPPVVVVSRPTPPPPPPPPLVVVRQPTFPPPGHSAETHEACPSLETVELVVTPPILGRLEQSHAALATASQLEERVVARLEQATKHRVALTRTIRRPTNSTEVTDAVAMFRKPQSARQAFIASQVFGPPRSAEPAP